MNKKVSITTVIVIVIVAILIWTNIHKKAEAPVITSDYKTISYQVEGTSTTMNGVDTKYFGNEATGDLNGDGKDDVAFLITHSGGGSGTFYYVVVAVKTNDGYTGTNAVFLGDRIAPQTTEIKDGQIVVNYADRKPTEPMTAAPSVGVSRYFTVSGVELKEVKQTSTDEGDMTLSVGKSGTVGNISITMDAFLQDYRCPVDVVCIEAGAVVANVTMVNGSTRETRNFPSDESPYPFAGHHISITSVTPAAHANTKIEPNDYRITFHVSK